MEINSYTRHHELPANEGDYGILWGGSGVGVWEFVSSN